MPFKRRFNYRKANWKAFTDELDQKIKNIAPTSNNYDLFSELVKTTAKRHIPRGCRVEYIPGLTKESTKLYKEYVSSYNEDPFSDTTIQTGKQVMESISEERRKTWHTLLESTDMTKNSKKAWSTIRKLRGDPATVPQRANVTAYQVANQLLLNAKSGKMKDKTKLNKIQYTGDTLDR